MAGRKENLKSLFKNTRSRVIIIFTAILLITAVVIGVTKLKLSSDLGAGASANLSAIPGGIQSIPGALDPTVQYAKLQETQNVDQAQNALQKGGSAIPTIIRTQALGEGVEPIGVSQQGEGGVGFTTLARDEDAGAQRTSWIQALQSSSCSKAAMVQVVNEGATLADLKAGCSCVQLKDNGYQLKDLIPICSCQELKAAGFNTVQLKQAGLSAGQLRLCGFDACELRAAGFSPQQMKDGGFSDGEMKGAGYTPDEIAQTSGLPEGISEADVRNAGCGVEALKRLRAAGVSAAAIRRISGCTAAQLAAAGYSPEELKNAGFSATDLKNAGFNANQLKAAGFSAKDLRNAGFTPTQIKNAGYSEAQLQDAGLSSGVAGLGDQQSALGLPTNVAPIPSIAGVTPQTPAAQGAEAANAKQLQAILSRQNQQLADQRYQQKIQQRVSQMLGTANQSLQSWQRVSVQAYVAGDAKKKEGALQGAQVTTTDQVSLPRSGRFVGDGNAAPMKAIVKTGDILFAVIDTSVNSDEPGPILATIVSGRLKGSKLIGSFNLPSNSDKMVISFNTLSVPGAAKTTSVSAYAIDANTARTALSSDTNHHYLMRYGSLFASTFLEGFGNAFQSANTSIIIGGTGGGNNIQVTSGVGRSVLENAVIGLATLGKSWAQVAQQNFSRPTTVQVYSGTGIGVLFTQDLTSI